MRDGFHGFRGLLVALVLLAPATAMAHAWVMQPPARDVTTVPNIDDRAHKSGPCGGVPRFGKPMQYEAGATVTVKWQESIDHQGCFQIAFSPDGDKDWVTLKQINDPNNNPDNMVYTDTVKLPQGVTCQNCTLVVRQLMLDNMAVKTCTPDAAPPPNDTYYSCADIRVGDFPDAGDGVDPPATDGGATSSSGGPTDPSGDGGSSSSGGASSSGGSKRFNNAPADDGGCSIGFVGGAATGVFSFIASGGLGLLAIARRRRRRRAP